MMPMTRQTNSQQSKNNINFKAATLEMSEKSIYGALKNTQNIPFYREFCTWKVEPLSEIELKEKAKKIFTNLQDLCNKYKDDDSVSLKISHSEISRKKNNQMSTKSLLESDELLSLDHIDITYRGMEEKLAGRPNGSMHNYFDPGFKYSIDSGPAAKKSFASFGFSHLYNDMEMEVNRIDKNITDLKQDTK